MIERMPAADTATCRRSECNVARHPRWTRGTKWLRPVQDIIEGVEVLTTIPEWFAGGTDKQGEMKMTVLVGESGAVSILNALDAAGFVIVSKEALKAGSDGYG